MDTGHAAWILTSASLVLLMTPALALFYGGMTRTKSILNMMMMSFSAMGVVMVVYVLWGYSMSYASGGEDSIGGFFDNPFTLFGLRDVSGTDYLTVAFQATFAIITAALISGALAERVKFSSWLLFLPLWVTLAYFPLAHMVWGGGFLSGSADGLAAAIFGTTDGAATIAPIDYAGGTVVHINAGMAALVLVLLIGKRRGFGKEPTRPGNLPLTMLGAGLLWFGWFGFNVGSYVSVPDEPISAGAEGFVENTIAYATAFSGETGLVWVNTSVAAAAAIIGWLVVEKIRDGKATSLGAASGIVAGLVAITPACGALSPIGAIALGIVAGGLCALAVGLKFRFGYDDSLDVVGVHLVGGLVGTLGIGFLAVEGGLLYGDGIKLFVVQAAIAAFAILWSGVFTLLIGLAIKAVMGWRVAEEDEVEGIDLAEHGESGYDLAPASGVARPVTAATLTTTPEGAKA
ncbi:ammonium transporter [Mumia sp. zg.B53]|uniref:ammonium transporter n=1 Tax=unclassified Mumia TaxID=2621872 RepID=UPI001C6F0435|nr:MULTISPECIES: ammonium transporter [unclassified Mumia]MBW9205590.1 ammonium transporter [Mumia sp. zg.B17]MBW9208409.1 ammonium transporter [Mumia sp. zg.B21]MBW9216366.1 ammonium transporter [Mumia sp. zg.B53]MDD9348595.1 ammonium transporter [Mumia sp.]